MDVNIGNGPVDLDLRRLAMDLEAEDKKLITASPAGELVLDDLANGDHYEYRREVWQMREPGEGINNQQWGGHEWEFCRSIKLTPEDT